MGFMTGKRAYFLAKQYIDNIAAKAADAGFKVQIETSRDILEEDGHERVFYFVPKENGTTADGYDEYVWTATEGWEQVGVTDFDLSELEATSNLVTSLSAQSTDEEYPSAACVYNIVGDLNSLSQTEEEPVA